MPNLTTFSSLQYRDYRYLWGSMLFSSTGQWMEQVALSWLVWELTEDPLMLGAINGARAVPFLLSPLGGVAADRIDRKLLMLVTQVIVMALSVAMAFLLFIDVMRLWMVFAFTICSGVTWAFNQPVRQALYGSKRGSSQIRRATPTKLRTCSSGYTSRHVPSPRFYRRGYWRPLRAISQRR